MRQVRLACHAMATRFELVLAGAAEASLRAAGEEALALIQRLEFQLSCYRPHSEIGRINACAAERAVRVDGDVFALLLRARQLGELTGGTFDPTVGPLMRCWGLRGRDGGRVPTEVELSAARACVGMDLVELDAASSSVRFARPGVALDPGAIGKGYALERAAALLRELGVPSALLHGGTSSVQAVGSAPDGGAWPVAIEYPDTQAAPAQERVLAIVGLRDQALSVSAGRGKQFRAGDTLYGHVLDPRTGRPARAALLAAVVSDSGTDADALSTALLVLGREGPARLPRVRTLVLARGPDDERDHVSGNGIPFRSLSNPQRGRLRPLPV